MDMYKKRELRKKDKMGFYNLDAIISVGYRVNSLRVTQFRRWATNILKKFKIKCTMQFSFTLSYIKEKL